MADEQIEHLRGLDFFEPTEHSERNVTIVGCGGIGSPTAILLSKMFGPEGPSLTLIDYDVVEPHNIPNQFFAHTQVGIPKVEALSGLCSLLGGARIDTIDGRVEDHADKLTDIVIVGVDTMAVRDSVRQLVKGDPKVLLLIDGRLLMSPDAQMFTVYTIDPQDEKQWDYYEKTFFTDEEAEPATCTARAVIDVSFSVASVIGRQVRKFLTQRQIDQTVIVNVNSLNVVKGITIDARTRDRVST